MNVVIRECHAKKTLDLLTGGHAEIGIIRFREGYEEYFQEVAATANLTFRTLSYYDDVILMHKSHPLAHQEKIRIEDMSKWTEIVHGDNYILPQSDEEKVRSQIYTVDRQAQLSLLVTFPGSYMWSVPQKNDRLAAVNLVQKNCVGYTKRYCEALVYNHQHTMNALESSLLNKIIEQYPQNM